MDESALQSELKSSSSSSLSPSSYTRRLAEAKAYALAVSDAAQHENKNNSNVDDDDGISTALYLGSDTIVEIDGCILEKPKDSNDAKRMLNLLSGREHHVHTGVALYRYHRHYCGTANAANANANANANAANQKNIPYPQISLIESFTDTTSVSFTDLTKRDIDTYIASGEPSDKAGAYGIQGIGGQFVTAIHGDFFTVMGLPMHKTSRLVASALQE